MKKTISITVIIAVLVSGCINNKKTTQSNSQETSLESFSGDYVSSEYNKRSEGYDWVAVTIKQKTDSTAHISVRSRADRKKPTCTFDADAVKTNNNTLMASVEGKNIVFTLNADTLKIDTEKKEDINILNYFCSGGGSLMGAYKKINEALDKTQIDSTVFLKFLSLQNISFEIRSTGEGSIQQLTIQPIGLKGNNEKISTEVDGTIVNAEIEDLNSDGYPEVLIYTVSAGSGSYGNVIGYSVNNGKSISQIYFPNIADNAKANKGYMGHDEFTIIETHLAQRFQTYNLNDTNSKPTGNMRQILYKLIDGEASRQFVVDKIIEFPAK